MPSLLISPGLARRLIGHAAGELHRQADDGAVDEAAHERVAAVDGRPRHDAAGEGVALVEHVGALVAVQARRGRSGRHRPARDSTVVIGALSSLLASV